MSSVSYNLSNQLPVQSQSQSSSSSSERNGDRTPENISENLGNLNIMHPTTPKQNHPTSSSHNNASNSHSNSNSNAHQYTPSEQSPRLPISTSPSRPPLRINSQENMDDVCPLDKKSPTPFTPNKRKDPLSANSNTPGRTVSNSPQMIDSGEFDVIKKSHVIPTKEAAIPTKETLRGGGPRSMAPNNSDDPSSKISAYARLDFENFTFFVQTLQVVLGRKSNDDLLQSSHHAVDVHLSSKKAISRRHAKIFYNFGTQRFELSILGRNGAFVDDLFVEKGITVPLTDCSKIQIGDIPFTFVLPSIEPGSDGLELNPSDAINLRSNLYNGIKSSKRKSVIDKDNEVAIEDDEEIEEGDGTANIVERIDKGISVTENNDKNADVNKTKQDLETSRKHIQRRMSLSRRKSLATASIDEINEILKELGPEIDVIDDANEEDSDVLDAQIQSILDEYKRKQSVSNIVPPSTDIGPNDNLFTRKIDIKEEEDEIDKLVNQHNLSQGVQLDETFLDGKNVNVEGTGQLDLSGLDQEIATLAPLIDAHHQDMLRKNEPDSKSMNSNQRQQGLKNPPFTIHQPPPRTTPLMGKPAVPRMGRPASIQPPASRLYGRPASSIQKNSSASPLGGLSKAQLVNNRLTTTTSPLAGLPTHLVAAGQGPLMNSSLKVSHGKLVQNNMHQHIPKPMPPKPPQPILEVPLVSLDDKANNYNGNKMKNDDFAITTPLLIQSVKILKVCEPKSYPDLVIVPKYPRKRKDPPPRKQTTKKVYSLEEIPEQYRIKPSLSYSVMITNVLKAKASTKGLTATDVAECIKESYPYYKYCADGWQFSINHNLALNRIFKKMNQIDNEWTWGIDDAYVNERERVRMKQQEIAASKAKAAALKAEELKQKQRLEAQQAAAQSIAGGRPGFSPYSSLSSFNNGRGIPQSQFISQLQQQQSQYGTQIGTNTSGKQKTIAELASEIRRDGLVGSKAPLYFKPTSNLPSEPAIGSASGGNNNNIKAQLAANRANSLSTTPPAVGSNPGTPPPINNDTKKSLAYLQKELFTLYKARKLSYNTATTTEIITKALATTIAQVNVIGAKAGCGNNALSFLVEKAPQQVSKILDIALSKSIKEKQGMLSSRPSSRGSTPGPSPSSGPSPVKPTPSLTAGPTRVEHATGAGGITGPSSLSNSPTISRLGTPGGENNGAITPTGISTLSGLSKPPSFNSKPPTYVKSESSPRPPQFTSAAATAKAQMNASSPLTPVLTKPPQFLSNKPSRPGYQALKPPAFTPAPPGTESGMKRELEDKDDQGKDKVIRIE
ncbi:fork-head transcriptional regulator Fhl1p [[Candida] railenensis]|uniref:Fork-head transcriptional regulator Fhl1p n=1 Tax=[Candida] railenensis TaxID=45579 RepID=A0A9P0VYY2_9ASCO|nr:fork-head transcriptional regulator Fhl1p [[Candida] railenensis]